MSNVFTAAPFPEAAWSPGMKDLALHVTQHVPQDWYRQIALRAPPPSNMVEADCRAVLAAKAFRAGRNAEITAQAGKRWAVIAPVQQVLGEVQGPVPRQHSEAMINAAIDDLTCGVFQLKIDFNRGRPYHCCDLPLEPYYQNGDPRYPGHPSYPGGHSAQAFTTALLYAHLFPKLECALLTAARRVGVNREVAGLHFPSDTDAGFDLASQFVAMLVRSESFAPLLIAARQEWPELI